MPKKIIPCCHNLNQDIARWYKISDREALGRNREIVAYSCKELLEAKENFKTDFKIEKPEYNALWRAFITKQCYQQTAIGY